MSEDEKRAACMIIVKSSTGLKAHGIDFAGLISSMASISISGGSEFKMALDAQLTVFDNTRFEMSPEAADRMLDAIQHLGNRCPPPDVLKQFYHDYYKELLLRNARGMPSTTSFKGVRGVKKPAGTQLTRQNINYLEKQIEAHKDGTKILSEAKLAEYEQRLQFGKVPFQISGFGFGICPTCPTPSNSVQLRPTPSNSVQLLSNFVQLLSNFVQLLSNSMPLSSGGAGDDRRADSGDREARG